MTTFSTNFFVHFTCNYRNVARNMIDLLEDLDLLLQTEEKFLLGKWIADAKSLAVTEGVIIIVCLIDKLLEFCIH